MAQDVEKINREKGHVLTVLEMQEMLSDTARDIRDERIDPVRANAIANINGKLLQTVKTQMDYAKYHGVKIRIPMLETSDAFLALDGGNAKPEPI